MNDKSVHILELPKILEQLARHTAFSASRDLALDLKPTPYLDEAQDRQQETSEARLLINTHDHITVGGARDVRPDVLSAERGIHWSRKPCSTSGPRCARPARCAAPLAAWGASFPGWRRLRTGWKNAPRCKTRSAACWTIPAK